MESTDKSDDERNQSHSSLPSKQGFESWSKATVCRVGKREGGLALKTKDIVSPAKAFIFVRAYTVGAISGLFRGYLG
jgi:hypothetical protein